MQSENNDSDATAHWPKGVRPIGWDGLGQLGKDDDDRLYWDGRPVQMASRLRLTKAQAFFAVLAALATLSMAVFDAIRFFTTGQ